MGIQAIWKLLEVKSKEGKMMEDKRKEELKNKTDKIQDLNRKIDVYEGIIGKTIDTLEFLDAIQPHHISLTGYSDNEGYRENEHIELYGSDLEEVVALIKKKLGNRVDEYKDKILEAYQALDKLLK